MSSKSGGGGNHTRSDSKHSFKAGPEDTKKAKSKRKSRKSKTRNADLLLN